MANIGLTNLWYSFLTENNNTLTGFTIPTYDGARSLGKAVSCAVEITSNTAKLYGDDVLAESDTSFASGKITLGVTDDDEEVFAPLLGHEVVDGVVNRGAQDTAPYVGVGRVVTKMVNGAYKYKAEFIYKAKFSEPNKDEKTKGESVEFSTPSIVGDIMAIADANNSWSASKTFGSKAEALEFIKTKLGGSRYTVSYDLNGGTGTAPASAEVQEGDSVTLPDGSGITPPANKVFDGWSLAPNAETVVKVTSPYTPTASVTLGAVWKDA